MSNSPNLGLPFLQASQAQKHVTVNDALSLLDGAVQLILQSVEIATPPGSVQDGHCYGVPQGAVNAWEGQDGTVAIFQNGGWLFAAPRTGWRAFVVDKDSSALFDGTNWKIGAVSLTLHAAATRFVTDEIDHVLGAGPTSSVPGAIPGGSMVFGVAGRVVADVTGSLATWRIGVAGADNRYGSGMGLPTGTWLRGLSSSPVTYYSDTDLVLTGEGGDFAGGTIRLSVHRLEIDYPDL